MKTEEQKNGGGLGTRPHHRGVKVLPGSSESTGNNGNHVDHTTLHDEERMVVTGHIAT